MADISINAYKAELEGVKAPLGIILYLIRRDNLDIYDIPIAKITKDYLQYLDLLEQHQIDLAGEFFVLAATLMRIKAQLLLRRDDDEEDPREELVRNLLEYKKMVEAAKNFKEFEAERRKVFNRPVPQQDKEYREEPVLELNLYEVMKAFREIMAEFEGSDVAEIEREIFTMEEKIDVILTMVSEKQQVTFRELFGDSSSRLEVIVTFIAMLELMKRAMIKSKQEGINNEIWIYRVDKEAAATMETELNEAVQSDPNEPQLP